MNFPSRNAELMERRASPVAAALWMTFAQACFAGMNVSARLGAQRLAWQQVATARFVMGALVALVVAKMRGVSLRVENQKRAWMRTLFGTAAATGTFFTLSAAQISLGDAITLISTGPIFIALLSWPLLGEKVRAHVILATALSFVGMIVVVHPTFRLAPELVVSGLFTAVSSAFAMIFLRKLGAKESGEAVSFHFACFAMVAMFVFSLFRWKPLSLAGAPYLVLTGVLGGIAQIAMTRAYSLDRAARVSVMMYLGVVFTRLFALPIFGESPSLEQVLGSALVIGSGAILAWGSSHRARTV